MKAAAATGSSGRFQRGYTLIELLAVIIIVAAVSSTWTIVRGRYGVVTGVMAAMAVTFLCACLVVAFYRISGKRFQADFKAISEKYSTIYRVRSLPDENAPILKGEGVRIQVGDYGWDAEPLRDDGLIYLHGLSTDWLVLWYAGFRPDQVERVGPKPRLQYDLPYAWICAGADTPPCAFPASAIVPKMATLGHPTKNIGNYVQGRRMA
jgi:prepilin-type N-terminal cleavage/methylation domain-containing protein